MIKSMLFLLCAALPVASAGASGLRMTVEQPHFTCDGNGRTFSHVAYVPHGHANDDAGATGDGAPPLPCCDGRIGCAQFLSTDTIIHRATRWHG